MSLACFNSASFVTSSGLGISVSPTVEVRRESDSGLAAIFSDAAGTAPITNPSAFADSVGRFKFYAAGSVGGYSILVTKGAESFTLRNVGIGTLGQLDSADDANVIVQLTGTGSVATTQDARNAKVVYLQDYGTPTTDGGDSLQKAHDALGADGGEIVIPPSATPYPVTSTAAFTKAVKLTGHGYLCSEFLTTTSALPIITTTRRLEVDGVGFTATGAAAGTAFGIKILAAADLHTDSHIRNCFFQGFARQIWSERTAALRISHNRFAPGATGRYGLYLENLTNPDEGDSFVNDNYFAGGTGETSIYVASTSGINLSSNKFNGAVAVHLDVAPTTNVVGNFLIDNNSFEGQATAAIRLIATSGSITKSVIHGNQFSSGGATQIIVGQGAIHTSITGNTFNDVNAANGVGIDVQASSYATTIVGNAFHQILTAINSTGNITGQTIKANRFFIRDGAGSENVTNFYLGGEDDNNVNSFNSEKEFEIGRLLVNTSDSVYVNAVQFKGDCVVDIHVCGIIQGVGNCAKYRKVMISSDTTATDLIALVDSGGAAFDIQVASSGGFTVVGIKRATGIGTSATVMVTVKITGFVRSLSAV